MAHLKTKATTGNSQQREQWKWSLVRGLYERGFERKDIIKLFQAVDRMMTLPPELQQSFEERLNRYEEEKKMPLLSNMELRGIEKGIEQGIEQGIERGAVQNARESVMTVLRLRLTEVSPELIDKLNNISDLSVLKQLLEPAISVNSLEEFQQLLERITRPDTVN